MLFKESELTETTEYWKFGLPFDEENQIRLITRPRQNRTPSSYYTFLNS